MTVRPWGQILFETVQQSQGHAFISDGHYDADPDHVLELAQNSLFWTLESAKLLAMFIANRSRAYKVTK